MRVRLSGQQAFDAAMTGLGSMISGFTLTSEMAEMYDRALAPFGYDAVANALSKVAMMRRSRDPFPSIGEIIDIVKPTVDPENDAVTAADLIIRAVSSIGIYRSDDARKFMGELAWSVVQSSGGWKTVCEEITYDNIMGMRAQYRNSAKSVIQRAKAGMHGTLPAIPAPDSDRNRAQLNAPSIAGLLKHMPKGGE